MQFNFFTVLYKNKFRKHKKGEEEVVKERPPGAAAFDLDLKKPVGFPPGGDKGAVLA